MSSRKNTITRDGIKDILKFYLGTKPYEIYSNIYKLIDMIYVSKLNKIDIEKERKDFVSAYYNEINEGAVQVNNYYQTYFSKSWICDKQLHLTGRAKKALRNFNKLIELYETKFLYEENEYMNRYSFIDRISATLIDQDINKLKDKIVNKIDVFLSDKLAESIVDYSTEKMIKGIATNFGDLLVEYITRNINVIAERDLLKIKTIYGSLDKKVHTSSKSKMSQLSLIPKNHDFYKFLDSNLIYFEPPNNNTDKYLDIYMGICTSVSFKEFFDIRNEIQNIIDKEL